MKLWVAVLGFFLLSACISRTVERETVVDRPGAAVVVPDQTPRSGDTTVIVPR